MIDYQSINLGFSRKAEVYDAYCEAHPVIRWCRQVIRSDVISRLPHAASMLELNAGTGADAAYFVSHGYRVHATDLADGMVAAIQTKIKKAAAGERFTAQQVSFTDLDQVQAGPFDAIFSNFGGLNCVPDLRGVVAQLPRLLKPGAFITWVIMPPICPWELAQALRGHWQAATRRLKPGGVISNVEGARFTTHYFSADAVMALFDKRFKRVGLRSISLFCPPSYMEKFPRRFPAITRALMQLDEHLGKIWPFNCWGDFFILTMQYCPTHD
jgi:ubiquinone/menaquinone biosynthesis C-methylase UbiE